MGQDFELGQVMVVVRALGRQISVSSRPAWSAERIVGQLGLLQRETLSQEKNKTKQINLSWVAGTLRPRNHSAYCLPLSH